MWVVVLAQASAQQIAPDLLKQLSFRTIGPIGNRSAAVVGVPGNILISYVGESSGGIWKTVDGGFTWRPIFDAQQMQSIGVLAIAPSDPNIVWAGTGEPWVRSNISIGDGVYKSTDAGETWTHMGLEKTGRIGRVKITRYQVVRRQMGAASATINRETSALHRMLVIGRRTGLIQTLPLFPPRLRENSPRQGSFEFDEYRAVRAHLPPPYQDVLDFAYYSGWRRREITELTWSEVDWNGGVVRLDPARSKTATGRVLPMIPVLRAVLERRRARRRSDRSLVFHQDDVTMREWKRCWSRACRAAGLPGRYLHDCRRTAVRNLVRASVPERVAMVLLGHKTRSVFDRYNIVCERELHQAGEQLVAYLQQLQTR